MGLADEYDYVMYGKVYKFDGAAAERVWVGQAACHPLDTLMLRRR